MFFLGANTISCKLAARFFKLTVGFGNVQIVGKELLYLDLLVGWLEKNPKYFPNGDF